MRRLFSVSHLAAAGHFAARPATKLAIVVAALFTILAASSSARAEPIVRDAGLIEAVDIEVVSLSMTDREAFDHLSAQGYAAFNIASFDDWTTGGIAMVRGDYRAAGGRSEIALSRTRAGRLVNISQTYHRPRDHFDAQAEIDAVRGYFAVADDDPECKANDHGGATCRIADAAENADLVFGLSIMPGLMLRYATRNHELRESY